MYYAAKAISHGGTFDTQFIILGVPPRLIARRCGQLEIRI